MTVVRGGRLLRWLGGILGLIMVGKAYRCESENSLEICGGAVDLITVAEYDRCERRKASDGDRRHTWAHNGRKVLPL